MDHRITADADGVLERFRKAAGQWSMAFALAACAALTTAEAPAQEAVRRIVTQGRATTDVATLYQCPVKVANHRASAVGRITASDGTVVTVPAQTMLQAGTTQNGADLFNECNQVTPQRSADVARTDGPFVEIDPDGELITGYIVADNYFELYVNGKLVAMDAVPFTPFNSVIVKFRAKRPTTYAFLLVDWEEQLGLGMEQNRGNPWHAGDGGVIARFSDGTVTDGSWRAQSFYIAPLASPDDVVEHGNVHDTTALGRVHPKARIPACQDRCFAVHYPLPANWMASSFDDSAWPRAYEYTDEDIGVTNLPAYTRYPEIFAGSRWIWTVNLVFDNLVIARKTMR
jgi:hypothetical protein